MIRGTSMSTSLLDGRPPRYPGPPVRSPAVAARVDGKVIVVVGGDTGIGSEIALGLGVRGAVVAVTGTLRSREGADAAMDAAIAGHGPLDVVVHAAVEPESLVPTPFLEFDEPAWERVAEDPIS